MLKCGKAIENIYPNGIVFVKYSKISRLYCRIDFLSIIFFVKWLILYLFPKFKLAEVCFSIYNLFILIHKGVINLSNVSVVINPGHI